MEKEMNKKLNKKEKVRKKELERDESLEKKGEEEERTWCLCDWRWEV